MEPCHRQGDAGMLQATGMEPHIGQGCQRIHWSHCFQPSAGTCWQCLSLGHLQGINTPEPLWKGQSRAGTPVPSLAHRWGQAGPCRWPPATPLSGAGGV